MTVLVRVSNSNVTSAVKAMATVLVAASVVIVQNSTTTAAAACAVASPLPPLPSVQGLLKLRMHVFSTVHKRIHIHTCIDSLHIHLYMCSAFPFEQELCCQGPQLLFPMYTVPVAALLEMVEVKPHEET